MRQHSGVNMVSQISSCRIKKHISWQILWAVVFDPFLFPNSIPDKFSVIQIWMHRHCWIYPCPVLWQDTTTSGVCLEIWGRNVLSKSRKGFSSRDISIKKSCNQNEGLHAHCSAECWVCARAWAAPWAVKASGHTWVRWFLPNSLYFVLSSCC